MNNIKELKEIVEKLDLLYLEHKADEEDYYNRKLEKEDRILNLEMLRDDIIKNLD